MIYASMSGERISEVPTPLIHSQKLNRRRFFLLAGSLGATALVAACSPSRPEAPVAVKPEAPLSGADRAGTAVAQARDVAPAVAPVSGPAVAAAKPVVEAAPAAKPESGTTVGDKLKPAAPEVPASKPAEAPVAAKPAAPAEQKPAAPAEQKPAAVEAKNKDQEYIEVANKYLQAYWNNDPKQLESLLRPQDIANPKLFDGKVTINPVARKIIMGANGVTPVSTEVLEAKVDGRVIPNGKTVKYTYPSEVIEFNQKKYKVLYVELEVDTKTNKIYCLGYGIAIKVRS